MAEIFSELGSREKAVARLIMSDYPLSAMNTVTTLADKSNVSTATVLRLVGKLGFNNYSDFQAAVKHSIRMRLESPAQRISSIEPEHESKNDSLLGLLDEMTHSLKVCKDNLVVDDIWEAVTLLSQKNNTIYCIGGRYSNHIVRIFSDYLAILRNNVHFVDGQPEGWAKYLAQMNSRSIVVAVDIRRYQKSVQRFSKEATQRKAKVILVTDQWADANEFTTHLQFNQPCDISSTMDSLVTQLGFLELLIAAYIEVNGKSARQRLALFDKLSE